MTKQASWGTLHDKGPFIVKLSKVYKKDLRTALALWGTWATIAVVGCSSLSGEEHSSHPPNPSKAQGELPPEPEKIPPPSEAAVNDHPEPLATVIKSSFHVVTWRGDALDECVDFELALTPSEGQEEAAKRLIDDLKRDSQKSLTKDRRTSIKYRCQKAFSDRTVLASCLYSKTNEGEIGQLINTVSSYYYAYSSVGESDSYMRDCLEMGGTWDAIDRDSREWRRQSSSITLNRFSEAYVNG